MKDRQVAQTDATARVPLLSALLHCITVPVTVFLRSSFGYVYLRPKSVFFALSWAFTLFAIYAWYEPPVWAKYETVCFFGAVTMALYWLNLLYAFTSQLSGDAEHDHYSGTSHPIRIMRLLKIPVRDETEMVLHLWIEPMLVLITALALRFALHETHISTWLFFAAPSMWLKEALNYWFRLRQRKRQGDILSDAEDSIDPLATKSSEDLPKATRKPRVKRGRGNKSE